MHHRTSNGTAAAALELIPRFGGGLINPAQIDITAPTPGVRLAQWSATPAGYRSPAFHVSRPRPDISAGAVEHAWRDDGAGPERYRSERAAQRAAARLNAEA